MFHQGPDVHGDCQSEPSGQEMQAVFDSPFSWGGARRSLGRSPRAARSQLPVTPSSHPEVPTEVCAHRPLADGAMRPFVALAQLTCGAVRRDCPWADPWRSHFRAGSAFRGALVRAARPSRSPRAGSASIAEPPCGHRGELKLASVHRRGRRRRTHPSLGCLWPCVTNTSSSQRSWAL